MTDNKKSVIDYFNSIAEEYHVQYDREKLDDIKNDYPANYFHLQLLINSFIKKGIRRVIEVGVGEGTPITTLGKIGIDVWGFDISPEMVKQSRKRMTENGMNPEKIFEGDIQDPLTYIHVLREGQFDALVAMGVMTHIENDDMVLENISTMVRPGGTVFIGFRNKMFSLFTFNRYTKEFIMDDLLSGINIQLKEIIAKDLDSHLRLDMPYVHNMLGDTKSQGSDVFPSRFHNPFEVCDLFEKHNFKNIRLRWYHYHPAIPYLEKENPLLFRQEAIRLEHESSNWRGIFLCSAFVVEAIKGEE